MLPSSMRVLEHPMSPPPRYIAGLETGTTTLASAKAACVSGPPRRGPAAVPPGCLGRFVSTVSGVGLLRLPVRPI